MIDFFNEYHQSSKYLFHFVPVYSTIIGLGNASLKVTRNVFGEDEEKREKANAKLAKEIANNILLKIFFVKDAFQKMVIDNICEYFNEGYQERLGMNRELRKSRRNIE